MGIFNSKSDTHATVLLKADHREVDGLFAEFENTDDKIKQTQLVTQICRALAVHTEIEERVFYPESRRVLGEGGQDTVDEAFVEHASLKGLIQRLDGMHASDALFKAYVTVLKEYVQHHVKEEEAEYFPAVEKTSLDMEAVGARMKALKDQLMATIDGQPKTRGVVSAKLLQQKPLETRAMAKAA